MRANQWEWYESSTHSKTILKYIKEKNKVLLLYCGKIMRKCNWNKINSVRCLLNVWRVEFTFRDTFFSLPFAFVPLNCWSYLVCWNQVRENERQEKMLRNINSIYPSHLHVAWVPTNYYLRTLRIEHVFPVISVIVLLALSTHIRTHNSTFGHFFLSV